MILGIRCTNKDFSYAILSGPKQEIKVRDASTLALPKGFSRGAEHKWLFQELKKILENNSIRKIVVKKHEGRISSKNTYESRLELEGVVFLAGGENNIPVFKKAKATLAKDICGKGKAKYIDTKVDTNIIPNFDDYSSNIKDAIICALSEIKL